MSILCRNNKSWVRYRVLHTIITKQYTKRYKRSIEHQCQSTVASYKNDISKRHFHNQNSLKVGSGFLDTDKLVTQLTSAATTDNIFIMLNTVDSLTPPQITAAFQSLHKLMYEQLMMQPWAVYSDSSLLNIQSFMNSESKEIFNPIIQCPEFDRLCYEAQHCRTTFSNSQLVVVTSSLLKLQVDLHGDAFRNLLLECMSRYENFDLECLMQFAEVSNLMKRSGFVVSARIARVLQKRWKHMEASGENFLNVTKLLHNIGYFMTTDTLDQYQKKILEMLSRHSQTLPLDIVVEMMDALQRFADHVAPEITEVVNFNLKNRLDELNVWPLSRVTGFLFWRNSDEELMGLVTRRFTEYCTGGMQDLRAADVVALIRMSQMLPPKSSSTIFLESLLEKFMGDLDPLLLRYVSCDFLVKTTNENLLKAYFRQVQQKMKDLFESLSCLLNVTHCLAKLHRRSLNFDRIFSQNLMHGILELQLGTQIKHVATTSRYLVQCFDQNDPHSVGHFAGKLIGMIPHMTLMDIANVGLGLGAATGGNMRETHERIVISFANGVLQRREEITDITMLNLLVKCIFLKVNSVFRDAIIADLEELYSTQTPTLRLSNVKPTCYLLKDLRIRIPVLCERLVDIVTHNGKVVHLAEIAQTLDLLARVNYRAVNLAALYKVAETRILELDHKLRWDDQVMHVLMALCSLARFHIFPEELIKRVFSLEFLTVIDGWSSHEKGHYRSQDQIQMYKYLTEINRSVMILCPHLGPAVAWFCHKNCIPTNNRLDSITIMKWKNFIYTGLKDAMRGEKYVKVGPLTTPYNHIYDFECYLDKNGMPLPVDTNKAHLRVAILLTTPSNYCKNTRTLSGMIESMAAQMEILGFKVILVPYYHLDSMIMSNSDSRRKYFQDQMASRS